MSINYDLKSILKSHEIDDEKALHESVQPEISYESILENKTKILIDLKMKFIEMPDCLEKNLMRLVFNIKLKLSDDSVFNCFALDNLDSFKNLEDEINKDLKATIERLNIERPENEDFQNTIQKIQAKINLKDFSSVLTELERFLRKLRPLDIYEMANLIQKSKEAAELIKNQDVILFLGRTGVGKSTTIHFLSGSKMVKQKSEIEPGEFIEHIMPVEPFLNPALKNVSISPRAESETRYINPIVVKFKDIGGYEDKTVIICDSPGFGDTAGPEVDIANGIGIIEAIKSCKSVKPVILFSYLRIGDRGEGIRELAHLLVEMISNIQDNLYAISYLFTKYPSDVDIHASLLNILKSVDKNPEESQDKSFYSIIIDMLEKTKDNLLNRLDPINQKPIQVLKSLTRTASIHNPENTFKFSITENSRNAIYEQSRINQLSIMSAVKRGEYTFIKYKLDELKNLKVTLKLDFINEIYQDCLNHVLNFINEKYKETTDSFNNCLENHNKIPQEDMEVYKNQVENFYGLKCLNEFEILSGISSLSEALIQNLKLKLDEVYNRFLNLELSSLFDSDNTKLDLDNMKLIASYFPKIEKKYIETCDLINNEILKIDMKIRNHLVSNELDKISNEMHILKKSPDQFKEHLKEDEIEKLYQNAIDSIVKHLHEVTERIDEVLKREALKDSDIKQITDCLLVIENAKETAFLRDHISKENLNNIYDNFIDKIMNFFNNFNNKINDLIQNNPDNSFQEMEHLIKEMDNIRSIPVIESKTSEIYHSKFQNIIGCMNRIQIDTEQCLKDFHENKVVDYSKLHHNLKCLKDAEWINGYKKGAYEEIMKNIRGNLIKHSNNLQEKFSDIDLDLQSYKNIENANKYLHQFENMRPFEATIPELKTLRENSFNKFNNSIDWVFSFVKENFNLQNQGLNQLEGTLKDLNNVRREYDLLKPAVLYLKQEGFESKEIIHQEINILEEKIQQIELKKTNQYSELKKVKEIFKSYSDSVNKNSKKKSKPLEILTSHGFMTVNDVTEKIQQIEDETNISEDEIKINQLQISKLNRMELKYDEIRDQKQISDENISFISKTKYKNIENLDKIIENIKTEMNNFDTQGQQYIFDRLNLSAEDSLNYLLACRAVRSIKDRANDAKKNLEDYIKNYKNFIQIDINYYFNQIKVLQPNQNNLLIGYVQRLKSRLQELKEIEAYPLLSKLINGTEIMQNLIDMLKENLLSLTDELHCDANDKKDLRNNLEKVKALIQLDSYVEGSYYKLYCEFQAAVTKEYKEIYKQIINSIEKYEFKNVSAELLAIDDYQINENAFSYIIRLLSNSVNELIEKTKYIAFMVCNTLEFQKMQDIVENLKKLESAKKHLCVENFDQNIQKKSKSINFLDKDFQENLTVGIKEIENLISEKILKYVESIEALISFNDFYEAEEKKEYLNTVLYIFGSFCLTTEISNKTETIKTTLEKIVDDLLNQYAEMPLSNYIINPPKNIIDQLQKVASRNLKYNQSLSKFKGHIINKIRETLKDAKESKGYERDDKLELIQSALWSLPDEIRGFLNIELQNLQRFISNKEGMYQAEFNRVNVSSDVTCLSNFMEKCSNDGMQNFLYQTQEEIIKKSVIFKDELIKSLEEDNVKIALNIYKKFSDYRIAFGGRIFEIENYFLEIENHLSNKLSRIISNFFEIETLENVDVIFKAFENFIIFMEFENFFLKITSKLETIYSKLSKFFYDIQSSFDIAYNDLDPPTLIKSMNKMKKWDPLMIQIKRFTLKHFNDQVSVEPLLKIEKNKSYSDMIYTTSNLLKDLKNETLNFQPFKGYEKERDDFYKTFALKLYFLKHSKDFKEHVNGDVYDVNSFEKDILTFLGNKFETIGSAAKEILENDFLQKKDFDEFRLNSGNLNSFEKNSRSRSLGLDLKNNIDEIDESLEKKLNCLQSITLKPDCIIDDLALSLIKMKNFADNLPEKNESINDRIDKSLKNFSLKSKHESGFQLAKLSTLLEQDPNGVGANILSEHSIFKGQLISIFNQVTQRHDIEYVLKNLEGDHINFKLLRENYEEFRKIYENLIKKYISLFEKKEDKNELLKELTMNIKVMSGELKNKNNFKVIDADIRHKIIEIMSYIFALWTLKNTDYFNEMKGVENRESFLFTPHPGQVISIFRMLGIGYNKVVESFRDKVKKIIMDEFDDSLRNNLVQVGTGEGKSLILGISSSVLALMGFEVSCACYSDYLSKRDYDSFLAIFESLGISQYIHYGAFNKICEKIINEKGDIRTRVNDMIFNKPPSSNSNLGVISRPKALLIDEVDVFFNEDFYGNIYTPLARLKDNSISNLTRYIWKNRNLNPNFKMIEGTSEYKTCCNHFKDWDFLIKEAVKDMLADVGNYKHDYVVQNDKLAYKEQDGISYDVVYGYKTLFAYFYEHETGKISAESLEDNISIGIRCGSFSYAEIPNSFQIIMGVTGTLKTLSDSERNIVKNVYNIKKSTFMPSVFGENKREFAKEADLYIENKDDFFNRLREKIDHSLGKKTSKRAVLVFFEKKSLLTDFYNSENISPIQADIQIITEEVSSSPKEKEMFIKRATTSGQITFLTRVFGRGTDFVCRDQNVITNGGVHVIQTFFSEELAEEIQIMGRTARQGKDGSYSMILLNSDLEKYLGVQYLEKIDQMRNNKTTYEDLNDKRCHLLGTKYSSLNENLKAIKQEHELGQKFISYLNENKKDLIRQFLAERNIGSTGTNCSRTICLMDATGSMGNLLNQAKNTVGTMFERASIILSEHGIPADSFQIQFAIYRDYDCLSDGLLQYSPWETKPDNLRKFMETITARGGGDYEEAIEIGLWHANVEDENLGVSQVILIGDAPAKREDQITTYRNSFGGGESYWKKTQFKEMTFYKKEVGKLKSKHIPVHAFYLDEGARTNFEEISSETGGKCERLNIDSVDGSNVLTNIVTEKILSNIGQAKGRGEELVNAYKAKFCKAYK